MEKFNRQPISPGNLQAPELAREIPATEGFRRRGLDLGQPMARGGQRAPDSRCRRHHPKVSSDKDSRPAPSTFRRRRITGRSRFGKSTSIPLFTQSSVVGKAVQGTQLGDRQRSGLEVAEKQVAKVGAIGIQGFPVPSAPRRRGRMGMVVCIFVALGFSIDEVRQVPRN